MELNDDQKATLGKWVEEGIGLSGIQKRLTDEFEISMTYMDVRFLVMDLGLDIQDKADPKPVDLNMNASIQEAADSISDTPGAGSSAPGQQAGAGALSVDIDRLTRPGSLVSGTVVFSDGVSAVWFLDQFGRLAVEAETSGYKPTPEDLQAFQNTLKDLLAEKGF